MTSLDSRSRWLALLIVCLGDLMIVLDVTIVGVALPSIREEHVHGLETRAAVEHGIAAIGRVVVAAAIIMATVFSAFILTPERVSKEFGLLLAVAILTDALIVKMTLIPAFFTLIHEKTWYMPRWLDKLLPNITIEPPHDGEERAPAPRPEPSEAPS